MLTQCDWAGRALQEAGDLTRAVPIIADTLADRLRVLGADHPDTLASRNNLAYAYRSAGRLDEATGLFEKVLADCERVLGSDHPVTSAVGDNLVDAAQLGRMGDASHRKTQGSLTGHVDHSDPMAACLAGPSQIPCPLTVLIYPGHPYIWQRPC